jgi:TetR/AcrR family transcriptional regulator, transcriptional repressor for nem operon
MGRPKGYDRETVLLAARDLFWEQGYERTSIADLEERTGLNRSSFYTEFGSKRRLFEAALQCYANRVIANLLAGLGDDHTAGLAAIAALFRHLGEMFRCDTALWTRGCLMVNTIAEMTTQDQRIGAHAAAYRDRLLKSFGAALARAAAQGDADSSLVDSRSHLLAAALIGIWLAARIDPSHAATSCQAIAREVESWRIHGPGN